MGRFFDSESPFWRGVSRVADIVILNVYFTVTALPLVTMGASFAALYDVAERIHDDRGGGVTRMFFRSFRDNFWRATATWAIVGPIGFALVFSWFFLPIAELTVVKTLFSLVYLLVFPFFFFLQIRFESGFANTLKNAFLIPLSRLPWAAGALAVTIGLLALTVVVAIREPSWLAPLLLGGVAMVVYATIPLLDRTVQPWVEGVPDAG